MELSHYGTTTIQLIGEKRDFRNPSIKEFSSLRVSGVRFQVSGRQLRARSKRKLLFSLCPLFFCNGQRTTDNRQNFPSRPSHLISLNPSFVLYRLSSAFCVSLSRLSRLISTPYTPCNRPITQSLIRLLTQLRKNLLYAWKVCHNSPNPSFRTSSASRGEIRNPVKG